MMAPKSRSGDHRRQQCGRKVRTPKSIVAGNARPSWGEDKCNRKYVWRGETYVRSETR